MNIIFLGQKAKNSKLQTRKLPKPAAQLGKLETRNSKTQRQYRDIKKLFFWAPSKCPIALVGPLANGRILKQLHHAYSKSNKTGYQEQPLSCHKAN